jgi:hypothetical protein
LIPHPYGYLLFLHGMGQILQEGISPQKYKRGSWALAEVGGTVRQNMHFLSPALHLFAGSGFQVSRRSTLS